ncbi:MAG: hypothetical protein WCP11_00735 [Candidatus Saccharibacteria bacterium]
MSELESFKLANSESFKLAAEADKNSPEVAEKRNSLNEPMGEAALETCVEAPKISTERSSAESRGKRRLDSINEQENNRREFKYIELTNLTQEEVARTKTVKNAFGVDLHYFSASEETNISSGFSFRKELRESMPLIFKDNKGNDYLDVFIKEDQPKNDKIATELHETLHVKAATDDEFKSYVYSMGSLLSQDEIKDFVKGYSDPFTKVPHNGYDMAGAKEEISARFFSDVQTHKGFWDSILNAGYKEPQKEIIKEYIKNMGFDFDNPRLDEGRDKDGKDDEKAPNIFKPGTKQYNEACFEVKYVLLNNLFRNLTKVA